MKKTLVTVAVLAAFASVSTSAMASCPGGCGSHGGGVAVEASPTITLTAKPVIKQKVEGDTVKQKNKQISKTSVSTDYDYKPAASSAYAVASGACGSAFAGQAVVAGASFAFTTDRCYSYLERNSICPEARKFMVEFTPLFATPGIPEDVVQAAWNTVTSQLVACTALTDNVKVEAVSKQGASFDADTEKEDGTY